MTAPSPRATMETPNPRLNGEFVLSLLMHIAVALGAAPGHTFVSYIEHLRNAGYVPPNAHSWVDHIRRRGNEANHDILLMERKDAEDLVTFLEMILKLVFEFPARVPPSSDS